MALGTYLEPDSAEARVVDALFDCVARWGMAKTTVEDVARSAGISRATVYRLFPGARGPSSRPASAARSPAWSVS